MRPFLRSGVWLWNSCFVIVQQSISVYRAVPGSSAAARLESAQFNSFV